MPKDKNFKRLEQDVTLYDSANAPKCVTRLKKWNTVEPSDVINSWDDCNEDEFDVIEETNDDGTTQLVFSRKKKKKKPEQVSMDNRPGCVYPEIIWYFISRYVKPEEIGTFAAINKTTYAITNTESFWRSIYSRYCENSPKLPETLKMENNCSAYGLRQRVVRALYYTYDAFTSRVLNPDRGKKPHQLLKMQCVNMWYSKGQSHWSICFKFKRPNPLEGTKSEIPDIMEELSRIDINPDDNKVILQVICNGFVEMPPPVMGMTLTKLNVYLSHGFRFHRLHLGFNYGPFISYDIQPEQFLVFDTVGRISFLPQDEGDTLDTLPKLLAPPSPIDRAYCTKERRLSKNSHSTMAVETVRINTLPIITVSGRNSLPQTVMELDLAGAKLCWLRVPTPE
ncbi:Transmembrane protein 183 [Eumeta japonica]|uniref:Transmembrane protein 183 n=1 Tax=Eumeta variegata TaxID=151549 RepID=A0A4C1W9N7_EUMVA|nr:Transmembrane protein 183 [Eumeta japonica]